MCLSVCVCGCGCKQMKETESVQCVCAACMHVLLFLDGLQNGPEEVQDGAWLCVTMGREVTESPWQGNS